MLAQEDTEVNKETADTGVESTDEAVEREPLLGEEALKNGSMPDPAQVCRLKKSYIILYHTNYKLY